jgi:hypothetical protein
MKIFDLLKIKRNSDDDLTLEKCVEKRVLTNEEKLRIEKDRAIKKWEKEVLILKKK